MKGFRQTQSSVHTWTGLLVGWVLFLIFINGTVAYWREEISRWMRPELAVTDMVRGPDDETRMVEGAIAALSSRAPDAANWSITLPSERGAGTLAVWQERGQARFRWPDAHNSLWIGGEGQPVAVRETRGGDFFYRVHFDLHYMPVIWARWLVGFCAMFMLVAIVTGIITHKKIFRDFFTFRPGKGQRSWLDGHNATAVLALPFHLMITYTGLITLMTLYMPWGLLANFSDPQAAYAELQPQVPEAAYAASPTPLAPIAPMLAEVRRVWGEGRIGYLWISNPGDASAQVTIARHPSHNIAADSATIIFDGVSGRALNSPIIDGPGETARQVMIGLHAGRFAPTLLRWFYFLSGLAGTAMVGTGLVMWTAKRRDKLPDPAKPPFGFRLVERLNIATVAGLPAGMVAMFWANRLLPVGMEGRWHAEVQTLFILWGLCFIHACLRPAKRGWVEQFGLGALLLLGLPLFDQVRGAGLWQHLMAGDGTRMAADLLLLALGLTLAAIAIKVYRHKPRIVARKVRPNREAALAVAGE
ncbi:PepSY domain-containing protein [Niveispirillum sp. SYP-B3756]|uniref:PepSY-associated TM helix domain-containing protein n=1 Tax=Niveispirillum sp. SYP-B3756 TaxID=2662178 RepID=UPI001290BC51|nr:PepSY-associated TM helix domain-containing protein [Niveispirillum sp. SYP-B3756]MQP68288.1 PepSY domain-containing protein [Niveispirillum sp. SYP-B3756]